MLLLGLVEALSASLPLSISGWIIVPTDRRRCERGVGVLGVVHTLGRCDFGYGYNKSRVGQAGGLVFDRGQGGNNGRRHGVS